MRYPLSTHLSSSFFVSALDLRFRFSCRSFEQHLQVYPLYFDEVVVEANKAGLAHRGTDRDVEAARPADAEDFARIVEAKAAELSRWNKTDYWVREEPTPNLAPCSKDDEDRSEIKRVGSVAIVSYTKNFVRLSFYPESVAFLIFVCIFFDAYLTFYSL